MNANLESEKIQKLQSLNATNDVARAFFDQASRRHKDVKETSVRRMADLCQVHYWQMREVFGKLDEIGVGGYIMGRRGALSRLKWFYSLKSIGKAAKGEYTSLHSINDEDADDLSSGGFEPDLSSNVVEHSYKLRADRAITLILPSDLTSREAERLAGWIKTLPFE